jgi:hypothetical protein
MTRDNKHSGILEDFGIKQALLCHSSSSATVSRTPQAVKLYTATSSKHLLRRDVFMQHFIYSVATITVKLLLLLLSIICSIAIYRLYFHPLSSVPGPRLAAISNIWYAYQVRSGRMLGLGKTLHEAYGPAVRVGPNEVWLNSKAAFSQIYSK